MNKCKITIVGSGIKSLSHLTIEAQSYITNSDKVLYLINEPAMQEWIQQNSKSHESLFNQYSKNTLREKNYEAIAEYIVETAKHLSSLCVVVYGHPTVFVQPSIIAANLARKNNDNVTILPGISSEDCLFADLEINPGDCGCASYEATDLLLHKRAFDTSSHLIIWQPYVIGLLARPVEHDPKQGLILLTELLLEKYNPDHNVTLYEAAQYPMFEPKITRIPLKDLPDSKVNGLTTLYIKPGNKKEICDKMLQKLKVISSSSHI